MTELAVKNRSYFRTQLLATIGVNVLSLAMVSGLLYSNFIANYTENLVDALRSKVSLLASASSSAILFHDDEAAAEVLGSLKAHSPTRFAQIFDVERNLFAEFKREGEQVDIALNDLTPGSFFRHGNIYLLEEIEMEGENIGFILISADTDSLQAQRSRFATTVVIVFLLTLFLAYVLNWRMQKFLTAPLRQIVALIGEVAKSRQYDKRLRVDTHDEIGALGLGVNSMLDTIQDHEQQLKRDGERLESLVQELFERAHYDALTKLPNRHLLMDRISHSIEAAARTNTSISLLFLDLDRFKVINDSLGHPLGDKLLVSVANKLQKIVRKADSICRWGGDEFVVMLENVESEEQVHTVAQKIISLLREPLLIDGHQLHASTCIGIASYPEDGSDAVTLLKHADISMYKAKERGPGHYCLFEEEMLEHSVLRLAIETSVRTALEDQELFLVYQPQIRAEDGSLSGLEALARWNKDGELISPETFIPVIEELGLMRQFTLWVLRESCAQHRQWQLAGLEAGRVAINMPVSSIMHPQCVENIRAILLETGLSPEFLELEITENTFMSSTSYAVDVLNALTDLGISIAIDDFGTGYSCMSYLRDLPIASLKIDGSFIRGLGQSQANDGIVQSIITLGHSLDLVLVAECVETKVQMDILSSMQCEIIQGHYFGKPMMAEDATVFIRENAAQLDQDWGQVSHFPKPK